MGPFAYSLQFRGFAAELGAGVLDASARAPGCSLVTTVGADGVFGRFVAAGGNEAVLESRLVLFPDGAFEETGTIAFGHAHGLRFRTLAPGWLAPSPDPDLRHGTAVWEVERGWGRLEGARGRIVSNFLLSRTGEVTDNHLGLLFLAGQD